MTTMLRAACLFGLVAGLGAATASAADMERLAVVERAATDVVTDTGATGDTRRRHPDLRQRGL